MIALTIMIFFTSAVFTLLNDTSNTFRKSYDNFVQVGNLHDFTIKENFSVTGEVNYQVNDLASKTNNYNMKLVLADKNSVELTYNENTYNLNINDSQTNLLFKKTTNQDKTTPKIIINNTEGQISVTETKGSKTTSIISELTNKTFFNTIVNFLNTDTTVMTKTKVIVNMSWNQSKTTLAYLAYFKELQTEGITNDKAPFTINVNSKIGTLINNSLYSNEQNTINTNIQNSEEYNFIKELKNSSQYQGIDVDQFNAININSSADNNYYKVISTQNHYDVDNSLSYGNKNLPINNPDNWSAKNIDKLNVFSGSGLVAPDKYSVLKQALLNQNKKIPKDATWLDHGSTLIASWKGALMPASASIKSISATVANISPGFASAHNKKVISGELATQLNTFLTEGQGQSKYDVDAYMAWLNALPDQYKVKVDNTYFVIRGISLSPDFMYPIMDAQHLTPNPSNEALVYTDWRGYEGTHTAFRNNPLEKFLVGTFPTGSSSSTKTNILNYINTEARKVMNFPSNIKIASLNNDYANSGISAARIGFIGTLVNTINHISFATIIFLIALTAFISIIITSKYITSRRSSLGILKSLGYNNFKIATSLLVFAVLASSIGATTGYLLGLSLQTQMINLFINYWTIPTNTIRFSWISFSTMFILPIVGLSLLTYIVAFVKLRKKPTILINPSSGFKVNILAKHFTKIFNGFKAPTKFKYSLAFSSIGKLLTLTSIIGVTITTATFYLSNHNSFANAQKSTQAEMQYKFAVDLESPTIEGGDYRAVPFKQLGFTNDALSMKYIDAVLSKKGAPFNTNSVYGQIPASQSFPIYKQLTHQKELGNIHFPSVLDSLPSANDPYYLEQHVQTKFSLNSYSGSGAWNIAVSKMPPNQRAAMNNEYNFMIASMLQDKNNNITYINPVTSKSTTNTVANVTQIFFNNDKNHTLKTLTGIYALWQNQGTGPSSPFVSLMTFGLNNYDSYRLNYGYIPLETNDETYSSINGPIKSINGSTNIHRADGKELEDQKIMGISENSSFINLTNDKTSINNLLFNGSAANPLIINQFAKKQYNLNVGDYISFKVVNDIYRYQRHIENNPLWTKPGLVQSRFSTESTTQFKIVGISDSYQGSEFFTSQDSANYALGFDAMKSIPKMINSKNVDVPSERNTEFPLDDPMSTSYNHSSDPEKGVFGSVNTFIADDANGQNQKVHFNGIFSNNNTDVYLSKTMNIYSPSGLYPAMDGFDPNDQSAIDLLKSSRTINAFKGLNIINNNSLNSQSIDPTNLIHEFNNIYGKSIYLSSVINVTPKDASDFMFTNFTFIENRIEKIIFITMLIISSIITITASNMVISDHKNIISNLKILGFRNREISNIFLAIYTPALILGGFLAIPLVSWLIKTFNFAIFKNTSIYILSPLHWWYFAISLGAVVVIFSFSYLLAWKTLSKKKAIDTLKERGN